MIRSITGAVGLALMGTGVALLVGDGDLPGVLAWLAGVVLLHDLVVMPVVLAVGFLLVRGRFRGPVRGALVVAGSLTAIASPVLLRTGTPANSSVLPLPYLRNWLAALGMVAVVTAVLVLCRLVLCRRRGPHR